MIGFDAVVRILLEQVPGRRGELVEHARVDRSAISGDLERRGAARRGAVRSRAGEDGPYRSGIAAFADQDVDDLTVLVDRAVKGGPAPATST